MKDPFGIQGQKVILSATNGAAQDVIKKEKKVDLVKVYLASIPSLETAKNDLESVLEGVQDDAIKGKVEGFIKSILQITEEILDLTKVAIRGEKEVLQESTQPAKGQAITPEMISGNPSVQAPVVTAPK